MAEATTVENQAASENGAASGESAVLEGIRIVDLGGSIASMVASLVLAEAGADVVLIEPPGGSDWRQAPGFHTWNRSKRSLEIDLESTTGLADLDRLLEGADVLIHSLSPNQASAMGLDDAALAKRFGQLIVSSVLGWPVGHAQAEAPVDDLITLARLGVLDEQVGQRDGPIFVRFPLGSWSAVWLAATGIAARLISRGRTGQAGPAHTSLAQGALVPMMMHWRRAETPSDALRIGMPKHDMKASLFECSDGQWIHVMPPPADHVPLMQEIFTEMGPAAVAEANAEHEGEGMPGFLNWGANIIAYRSRPAQTWLEELWANDIPAQLAAPYGSILSDEQARANNYVVDIDDPELGKITAAGLPMTLDPPASVRGPIPAVGQGGRDAIDEWSDSSQPADSQSDKRQTDNSQSASSTGAASSVQDGNQVTNRYPLDGLKVLDFGNFLAGPLAPMLLADLGATVVKIESTTGDPMRGADWPFVGCQRGKRAVSLDLKSPDSRPAVEALIKWADVVHHNLRQPAALRLGLDAESVRAINPDVIYCHVSSYGPTGPRSDWPGYDQLFQSSCGWEVMGAGADNPPMWHRFGFMDHLCAMSSAVATLLAVFKRDRTGLATNVAASLLGAGVMTNSETYIGANGKLADVPQLDQNQTMISPGVRILQLGDDWVAVAARSDDEISRLCSAAGCGDIEEIVDSVRSKTSGDFLSELADAGISAAPVALDQLEQFFDSDENKAAGMVANYPHPDWGNFEQPGALWNFVDQELKLDLAPPLLGQHTTEVLREVGLSQTAVEALVANGTAAQRAS